MGTAPAAAHVPATPSSTPQTTPVFFVLSFVLSSTLDSSRLRRMTPAGPGLPHPDGFAPDTQDEQAPHRSAPGAGVVRPNPAEPALGSRNDPADCRGVQDAAADTRVVVAEQLRDVA